MSVSASVHEITPYLKNIEILCQLSILLPNYCENVLIESFQIIVIGKQFKKTFKGHNNLCSVLITGKL